MLRYFSGVWIAHLLFLLYTCYSGNLCSLLCVSVFFVCSLSLGSCSLRITDRILVAFISFTILTNLISCSNHKNSEITDLEIFRWHDQRYIFTKKAPFDKKTILIILLHALCRAPCRSGCLKNRPAAALSLS